MPCNLAVPIKQSYITATRTVPLQHGQLCSCNSGCATSTRAVLLKHRLYRCNTDCAAATRLYRCNTDCALQDVLCRNTGSATTVRAELLQHELSQMLCFESYIGCASKLPVWFALDRELHGLTAPAQSAALFCFPVSGTFSTNASQPALLLSAGTRRIALL